MQVRLIGDSQQDASKRLSADKHKYSEAKCPTRVNLGLAFTFSFAGEHIQHYVRTITESERRTIISRPLCRLFKLSSCGGFLLVSVLCSVLLEKFWSPDFAAERAFFTFMLLSAMDSIVYMTLV